MTGRVIWHSLAEEDLTEAYLYIGAILRLRPSDCSTRWKMTFSSSSRTPVRVDSVSSDTEDQDTMKITLSAIPTAAQEWVLYAHPDNVWAGSPDVSKGIFWWV